jgi:hypothetical protein
MDEICRRYIIHCPFGRTYQFEIEDNIIAIMKLE